jgi:FtsP/CotA-like multicopper oxidase with cupredoxin domain
MIFRMICASWLAFGGLIWSPAAAQVEPKRFDLRIENGQHIGGLKVIRVRRGDSVEINWSANRRTVLHLHGYDIETNVEPDKPRLMSFTARATGRFPIEMHGGHHSVLIYLEVHPQ